MHIKDLLSAASLACIFAGAAAMAVQEPVVTYSMSAGARYHAENVATPHLPYDDGDWSALIGFEAHEGAGYWQLALDTAFGAGADEEVDLMLTPQLNLMAKDRSFVGGIGILDTYIKGREDGNEWTDLYYQFTLGFDFSVGRRGSFAVLAHYPFEDWGDLDEFEFGDVDISAAVRYFF